MGPEPARGEGSQGSAYDPSELKRHFKSNFEKLTIQMIVKAVKGNVSFLKWIVKAIIE